ncbi:FAD binding domain-containing protein [Labrys okinawensis]|uniref:FAD binding domain-containing protein n=1 Tax=Labrys okinawensis TaxID=346911 RepID=UPI0039BD4679
MDLNAIMKAVRPADRTALTAVARRFQKSDAWLAGGTGLFAAPQPDVRRVVDLLGMNWEPLVATEQGLTISATCSLGTLAAFKAPIDWPGATLIARCCRAFPSTFRNWSMATVGGNLCMALPFGPLIALGAALEGVCTIWTAADGERRLAVADFVRGPRLPALRTGEVLRSLRLPAEALKRTVAMRGVCLTKNGGSDALLIGALSAEGDLTLTVTASTRRPLQFDFDGMPTETVLRQRLGDDIPVEFYYPDRHGRLDWCQQMTQDLAAEICWELRAAAASRPYPSYDNWRYRQYGLSGASEALSMW